MTEGVEGKSRPLLSSGVHACLQWRMSLPPFPSEFYDLPDEQLALAAYTWWAAAHLESSCVLVDGKPVEHVTPELLEAILPVALERIRQATFDQNTDNEALVGVEKALCLIASGDPANLPRAGAMFRQHSGNRALFLAALKEAATGHGHQSAIASKPRPDFLQKTLIEIVTADPGIQLPGVIRELKRRADLPDHDPGRHNPRIERVDDGGVQWREPNKPDAEAPLTGLKDRLTNARKAVAKKSGSP
jgi:hypothetical protein